MRSSWRKGLLFLSQRNLGSGLPPAAQRNLTVLAAGTACSFFSIFADEIQYGAPKAKEKRMSFGFPFISSSFNIWF